METARTIVIVDDDREIATLMELALATPSRRIVCFSDGESALGYFSGGNKVDLILSDVAMEGYDRHRLLRHLRSNEHTAPTPVIFVTASDADGDRLGASIDGGVEYLRKPFEISELRERVDAALRRGTDAAARDPLTGLFGRDWFVQALSSALRTATPGVVSVAVVVTEIDGIRAVAQRAGQAEADGVVRRAAEIISLQLRTTDSAARIGDGKFATLHPRCDGQGASMVAERIAKAIAADAACAGVRARVGIALAPEPASADAADMMKAADDNASRSKGSGA